MPSISLPAAGAFLASIPADIAGGVAGLLGPAGLGIGAGTAGAIGTGVTGALEGAGLGAITDYKHPLQGAEFGALTGGITGGLGPTIGSTLGIGTTAGDTLAGAAGGALGGVATGQKPLTGAVEGALGGLTAGLTTPSAPAPGAVAGPSASSVSAPPGTLPPVDPTASGVASNLGISPVTVTPQVTAPSAAATAAPTSVDKFLSDPSLGGAWNVIKSNPSSVAGALGLGYDLSKQGQVPGLSQLKGIATRESNQAAGLQSAIETGQLPAGYQSALDQAKQSAKAEIRSKYASLGMSGSTPEAQELSQVDVNAVAQSAQIAGQLFTAGASEANLSNELLTQILGINQQQDAATGQAISSFAAAMGGNPAGDQSFKIVPSG